MSQRDRLMRWSGRRAERASCIVRVLGDCAWREVQCSIILPENHPHQGTVLMTVFFRVVGMEIGREIHEGALSDIRQAALPVVDGEIRLQTPPLDRVDPRILDDIGLTDAEWASATGISSARGLLAPFVEKMRQVRLILRFAARPPWSAAKRNARIDFIYIWSADT